MLTLLRVGIGARVIAFLCVCLLLGAVVGIWALGRYSHVANEVSRDTALRTADLAEAVKTQIMRNAYMTLRAMAGFQRVASRNAKDCNDVAYFFLKNTNGYVNVGSFLPDGIFYCAAVPSTLNFNARGLDWFDAAVTNGNFTMGGYHVSDITRSGVIVFALPVRDEAGKVSQVLTLEADIEYISKILTFPNLPEETSLTVIDQFGNVLVASPDIGTRPGDNIAQWDVARTAMTADAPIVTEWKGPDGATRLFAATSSRVSDVAIPGADRADIRAFSIIVGIPAQRITSAIMGPAQTAGAAVGVVFAIILVGIYLFIRHTLVKPVKEIQLAAERLTFGDPTARVTRKSYAGEIRTLANAFNVMATTLARREDDIRTSNARLQRIFETEPAGVTLFDLKMRIIDINKAGLEILGADSVDQVRGKVSPVVVIDEDLERYLTHVRNVKMGKTDFTTIQIIDLRGRKRWIGVQSANIQLDDKSDAAFISIARDKTEEVLTSAQLVQAQKMESIGRLTGGMAHDFNNLLTIIMGNAETLREELDDRPALKKLAAMIESAAQRGAELTHNMLAFARRQVLRPTELDTNMLLGRIVDMIKPLLGEDIRIQINTGENLWRVAADPAQMESAILNLSINARDAMPKGGKLTIETQNICLDDDYASRNPEAVSGEYVLIAVSDSGSGMSKDVLAHVFDPFFTTKEAGKGSGLGLSMVYGFVKQSHGHIKIYSEISQGTTIRIYLPKMAESPSFKTQTSEIRLEEARGTETILVTEDEESVRTYVTEQLRSFGYNVLESSSARDALMLLDQHRDIALLFTDVVLPGGMNGRQLADQARSLHPNLKVLYTTGYTENAVVHHGMLDAGVDLLSKPYHRADLAHHIRKVLDTA